MTYHRFDDNAFSPIPLASTEMQQQSNIQETIVVSVERSPSTVINHTPLQGSQNPFIRSDTSKKLGKFTYFFTNMTNTLTFYQNSFSLAAEKTLYLLAKYRV